MLSKMLSLQISGLWVFIKDFWFQRKSNCTKEALVKAFYKKCCLLFVPAVQYWTKAWFNTIPSSFISPYMRRDTLLFKGNDRYSW